LRLRLSRQNSALQNEQQAKKAKKICYMWLNQLKVFQFKPHK